MKGNLTYLIIWILKQKKMNGAEIAKELEKRKGSKPSPGTIYPALKELKVKGLITADKDKRYSLTAKGESECKKMCGLFSQIFYDMKEMTSCK